MGNASNNNSAAPRECCPDSSVPSRSALLAGATAPTRGELVELAGSAGEDVRAYVAPRPDRAVGVVVVFHDIYGFASSRTHHLCDEIADAGYLVVAVDFFGRALDGVMENSDIFSIWQPWNLVTGGGAVFYKRARYPWSEVERKLNAYVFPFIARALEGRTGVVKVAALGFCWGGWAVTRCAALSDKFACVIGAHPSPDVQRLQSDGPTTDEILRAVRVPVLYMPAGNDPYWIHPEGASFKMIAENAPGSKCIVFKDQVHGWFTRGNLADDGVRSAVRLAMRETLEFLGAHL